MNPQSWSAAITDYLEREGIIGALLPRSAAGALDRYQPSRVSVSYAWSEGAATETRITFKIAAPEDRSDHSEERGHWRVDTRSDVEGWGDDWETVTIRLAAPAPINQSEEFHAPGRFRVIASVVDEESEVGGELCYIRRLRVENAREVGGTLHAIRLEELQVGRLHEFRSYGVDVDIFYRATGLIGSLVDGNLRFAPYAFLPEPKRRPLPGPTMERAIADGLISEALAGLLRRRGVHQLFQFQADAFQVLGESLRGNPDDFLLTSGTGGGKTEAFLFPLLQTLEEDVPHFGIQGLFIYPTKALEADQARRFFRDVAAMNAERRHPVSIGVLDGDTPWTLEQVQEDEQNRRLRSPFVSCPRCTGTIRFTQTADGAALTHPTCVECGMEFPWVRVTREDIRERWPHLLLTVPDMLHRQISDPFAWMNHAMFGRSVHVCEACGTYRPSTHRTLAGERACSCGRDLAPAISCAPKLIVFDEAHLLKGIFGSQVALLIARLKRICSDYGQGPVFLGASATIGNEEEFGRQLFGDEVTVIRSEEEWLSEEPTRFHLFVLPVQVTVLNAIGHLLTGILRADREGSEANRVLVFSDAKRTVYQLESSLQEFYATLPEELLPAPVTRSHTADLSAEERRLVEADFDAERIRVLLATQTLEVGVDFQNLQLEVQTGATYSYNDYIQRVGRAGRQGVEALVVCVLRPQVPLDYYYFEHCRELVQFTPETLEDIPLRSDNPFLVERHAIAAIQDELIAAEPGARLGWSPREAIQYVDANRAQVLERLREIFIRPHSWDSEEIDGVLDRSLDRVRAQLLASEERGTWERLSHLIELSVRASDVQIPIESSDFREHAGISMPETFDEEEVEDVPVVEEELVE
jgi:superfamily II DNA or RNA helicase